MWGDDQMWGDDVGVRPGVGADMGGGSADVGCCCLRVFRFGMQLFEGAQVWGAGLLGCPDVRCH